MGRLVRRLGAERLAEPVDRNDFADFVEAAELDNTGLDDASIPAVALICSRRASTCRCEVNQRGIKVTLRYDLPALAVT